MVLWFPLAVVRWTGAAPHPCLLARSVLAVDGKGSGSLDAVMVSSADSK